MQRPLALLLLVIAAIHQAVEGCAVMPGKDVTGFVGRPTQRPVQAQMEGGCALAWIAVARDG